jgi:hypothetical protein
MSMLFYAILALSTEIVLEAHELQESNEESSCLPWQVHLPVHRA